MEWLIEALAVLLALLLAVIKSLRFVPTAASNFELERQENAGNNAAGMERDRRKLLPAFAALQSIKEIVISVLLAALLLLTHQSVIGALLVILYFFVAYVVAVRGWLSGLTKRIQKPLEKIMTPVVGVLGPIIKPLTAKAHAPQTVALSGDELRHLIKTGPALSQEEKSTVDAALNFGRLVIKDAMVPRSAIVTVDENETVGPLLLDRLHKAGHNIFIGVSKDLDHIKGLLYMHDATMLDAEVKKVKDALRPTVHYLKQTASLGDVLAASLQSGRQLFIVVDDYGNTTGLITLRDALARLMGGAPPTQVHLSTDPKEA